MSDFDLGKQQGYDLAKKGQCIPKYWMWSHAKNKDCAAREFAKGIIQGYSLFMQSKAKGVAV